MSTTNASTVKSVISALRHSVSSEKVVTEGTDYDAAVTLWNGAHGHRPAVVVRCEHWTDAQSALLAARDGGLPLSVRGRGYDWAGRSLREGGVVIDLSGMRRVTVDSESSTATVHGGASFGDVVAATQPYGLVPVTGMVSSVGAVATTLGGGYGPLSGRFGLASDNILAAEVILADGRRVTADAGHEVDLFWALHGGGGNFGVVTSLRIQLHPVPNVVNGLVMYPWSQAHGVLQQLGPLLDEAPDELVVQIGVLSGADGESVLTANPIWTGDLDSGRAHVEQFTRLGTPIMAQVAAMSYEQMLGQFDGQFPNGRNVEMRARNVHSLTSSAIVAALDHAGATKTSPLSNIFTHHFHGAATRIPLQNTAFGSRSPHQVIEVVASWEPDDEAGAKHTAWADDVSAALAPESMPGGYGNLLGPDAADQIPHLYGANTERLLAIKTTVDPDGVFVATPLPS